MNSMHLEQRGRTMAHAYFAELEKIALRMSPTELAKAPLEGLEALVRYNKHTVPDEIEQGFGLHHRVMRHVPGLRRMNEGAAAAHAMHVDGQLGHKEALQAIEQRKSVAHRLIAANPSSPEAHAAHDTLKKILAQNLDAPGAKTTKEELERAMAGKGSVEAQRNAWTRQVLSSGTALKIAGGVGLLGATAAGGAYAYDKATKPPEYPGY